MLTDLPQPDAAALRHSDTLADVMRQRIAAAGGFISFADYMQMALYEPGLGYYSAGAAKFGAAGDFVTAPEISSLFSACLAGQCAEVLESLNGGTVLELGAGSGAMAAAMLSEFARLDVLPDQYLIVEPSADLRERQLQRLQEAAAGHLHRVIWLDTAPAESFHGVIVGNEVVDALPVNRFRVADDHVQEICVQADKQGFSDCYQPAAGLLAEELAQLVQDCELPVGYVSEISLRSPAWLGTITDWLTEGAILLLDYGFSRPEYYMSERSSGTLRCYYRHRAHDNPYLWPGLQDITAWVDFSRLAHAAQAAGLQVAGFTTQANFLLAAGLERRFEETAGADAEALARQAHGMRQLLLPGEMGDAVKVLALTRGGVAAPSACGARDMRAVL